MLRSNEMSFQMPLVPVVDSYLQRIKSSSARPRAGNPSTPPTVTAQESLPDVCDAMLKDPAVYESVETFSRSQWGPVLMSAMAEWCALRSAGMAPPNPDGTPGSPSAAVQPILPLTAPAADRFTAADPHWEAEAKSILRLSQVVLSAYDATRIKAPPTAPKHFVAAGLRAQDPEVVHGTLLMHLGTTLTRGSSQNADPNSDEGAAIQALVYGWGSEVAIVDVLRAVERNDKAGLTRMADEIATLAASKAANAEEGANVPPAVREIARSLDRMAKSCKEDPANLLWWTRCRLVAFACLSSMTNTVSEVMDSPSGEYFRCLAGDVAAAVLSLLTSTNPVVAGTLCDVLYMWIFLSANGALFHPGAAEAATERWQALLRRFPSVSQFHRDAHQSFGSFAPWKGMMELMLSFRGEAGRTRDQRLHDAMLSQQIDILAGHPNLYPAFLTAALLPSADGAGGSQHLMNRYERRSTQQVLELGAVGHVAQVGRIAGIKATQVAEVDGALPKPRDVAVLVAAMESLKSVVAVSVHTSANPAGWLLTGGPNGERCLADSILKLASFPQVREAYPALIANAFLLFGSAIHHNVRDVVPALLEREVLDLTVAVVLSKESVVKDTCALLAIPQLWQAMSIHADTHPSLRKPEFIEASRAIFPSVCTAPSVPHQIDTYQVFGRDMFQFGRGFDSVKAELFGEVPKLIESLGRQAAWLGDDSPDAAAQRNGAEVPAPMTASDGSGPLDVDGVGRVLLRVSAILTGGSKSVAAPPGSPMLGGDSTAEEMRSLSNHESFGQGLRAVWEFALSRQLVTQNPRVIAGFLRELDPLNFGGVWDATTSFVTRAEKHLKANRTLDTESCTLLASMASVVSLLGQLDAPSRGREHIAGARERLTGRVLEVSFTVKALLKEADDAAAADGPTPAADSIPASPDRSASPSGSPDRASPSQKRKPVGGAKQRTFAAARDFVTACEDVVSSMANSRARMHLHHHHNFEDELFGGRQTGNSSSSAANLCNQLIETTSRELTRCGTTVTPGQIFAIDVAAERMKLAQKTLSSLSSANPVFNVNMPELSVVLQNCLKIAKHAVAVANASSAAIDAKEASINSNASPLTAGKLANTAAAGIAAASSNIEEKCTVLVECVGTAFHAYTMNPRVIRDGNKRESAAGFILVMTEEAPTSMLTAKLRADLTDTLSHIVKEVVANASNQQRRMPPPSPPRGFAPNHFAQDLFGNADPDQPIPPPPPPPNEDDIELIVDHGFNEEDARGALFRSRGNVGRALEDLMHTRPESLSELPTPGSSPARAPRRPAHPAELRDPMFNLSTPTESPAIRLAERAIHIALDQLRWVNELHRENPVDSEPSAEQDENRALWESIEKNAMTALYQYGLAPGGNNSSPMREPMPHRSTPRLKLFNTLTMEALKDPFENPAPMGALAVQLSQRNTIQLRNDIANKTHLCSRILQRFVKGWTEAKIKAAESNTEIPTGHLKTVFQAVFFFASFSNDPQRDRAEPPRNSCSDYQHGFCYRGHRCPSGHVDTGGGRRFHGDESGIVAAIQAAVDDGTPSSEMPPPVSERGKVTQSTAKLTGHAASMLPAATAASLIPLLVEATLLPYNEMQRGSTTTRAVKRRFGDLPRCASEALCQIVLAEQSAVDAFNHELAHLDMTLIEYADRALSTSPKAAAAIVRCALDDPEGSEWHAYCAMKKVIVSLVEESREVAQRAAASPQSAQRPLPMSDDIYQDLSAAQQAALRPRVKLWETPTATQTSLLFGDTPPTPTLRGEDANVKAPALQLDKADKIEADKSAADRKADTPREGKTAVDPHAVAVDLTEFMRDTDILRQRMPGPFMRCFASSALIVQRDARSATGRRDPMVWLAPRRPPVVTQSRKAQRTQVEGAVAGMVAALEALQASTEENTLGKVGTWVKIIEAATTIPHVAATAANSSGMLRALIAAGVKSSSPLVQDSAEVRRELSSLNRSKAGALANIATRGANRVVEGLLEAATCGSDPDTRATSEATASHLRVIETMIRLKHRAKSKVLEVLAAPSVGKRLLALLNNSDAVPDSASAVTAVAHLLYLFSVPTAHAMESATAEGAEGAADELGIDGVALAAGGEHDDGDVHGDDVEYQEDTEDDEDGDEIVDDGGDDGADDTYGDGTEEENAEDDDEAEEDEYDEEFDGDDYGEDDGLPMVDGADDYDEDDWDEGGPAPGGPGRSLAMHFPDGEIERLHELAQMSPEHSDEFQALIRDHLLGNIFQRGGHGARRVVQQPPPSAEELTAAVMDAHGREIVTLESESPAQPPSHSASRRRGSGLSVSPILTSMPRQRLNSRPATPQFDRFDPNGDHPADLGAHFVPPVPPPPPPRDAMADEIARLFGQNIPAAPAPGNNDNGNIAEATNNVNDNSANGPADRGMLPDLGRPAVSEEGDESDASPNRLEDTAGPRQALPLAEEDTTTSGSTSGGDEPVVPDIAPANEASVTSDSEQVAAESTESAVPPAAAAATTAAADEALLPGGISGEEEQEYDEEMDAMLLEAIRLSAMEEAAAMEAAQEGTATGTTEGEATTEGQSAPDPSTETAAPAPAAAAAPVIPDGPVPWQDALDPVFLGELPPELRHDVIRQHIPLLVLPQAHDHNGSNTRFHPLFLAALPSEIQRELLEMEPTISMPRPEDMTPSAPAAGASPDGAAAAAPAAGGPSETAMLLASVPADLRDEILLTCDLNELRSEPALLAEAEAIRARHEEQSRERMRNMQEQISRSRSRETPQMGGSPGHRGTPPHLGGPPEFVQRLMDEERGGYGMGGSARRNRGAKQARRIPMPKTLDNVTPSHVAACPELAAVVARCLFASRAQQPNGRNQSIMTFVQATLVNLARNAASAHVVLNAVLDVASKPMDAASVAIARVFATTMKRDSLQVGAPPPSEVVTRALGCINSMIKKSYWIVYALTRPSLEDTYTGPKDIRDEPTAGELDATRVSPIARIMNIAAGNYRLFNVQAAFEVLASTLVDTFERLARPDEPGDRAPGNVDPAISLTHPRHTHPLQWLDVVRVDPRYRQKPYSCNVCGVSYDTLSFHCPPCTFDLCQNCAMDVSDHNDHLRRNRRCLHLLLERTEFIADALTVLESTGCAESTGAAVTKLLKLATDGISAVCDCAWFEGNGTGTVHSTIGDVARRMTQAIGSNLRSFNAARSPPNANSTPLSDTDSQCTNPAAKDRIANRLELLNIPPSETGNQLYRLFTLMGALGTEPPRDVKRMWHAVQQYLVEVNSVLATVPDRSGITLPVIVKKLIVGFVQFHMVSGGDGSVSALERTDTELLMSEELTPSEVSNKASMRAFRTDQLRLVQGGGGRHHDPFDTPESSPSGATAKAAIGFAEEKLPNVVAKFAEANKMSINALISWDRALLNEEFKFMSRAPRLLDFKFKLKEFRDKLERYRMRGSQVNLTLSRKERFAESYLALRHRDPRDILGPIQIKFNGEEGIDAGGLMREWFQLLAEDIVNPDTALLIHSSEGMTFQPNPDSSINEDHLSYFKFVGRVIGLAVFHEVPIDVHFTRSVYRHIIGVEPVFVDLESIDPDLYSNMEKLLKLDVDELDLGLNFTYTHEHFGQIDEIELIPGGADIMLTNANKKEFIRKRCELRMTKMIQDQLDAMLGGFYDIIPRQLVAVFSEQELELVISGMPEIDVEDLRVNTDYQGYQPSSPQIRWFWECVSGMKKEDRANLLQFATGASKIPPGGFSNLEGMSGKTKFTIVRSDTSAEMLPVAHTCFNRIDLPPYPSSEILKEKLFLAITYGSKGFSLV